MSIADHDAEALRRLKRKSNRHLIYGVSGPSHVPILNGAQFGAENTTLSYSEESGSSDGGE
jgi:hypothetical protein